MSLHSPVLGGDCVEPEGGSQEEADGLGVFSPRCQPKGIWRVDQGGKALWLSVTQGNGGEGILFKFKEEFGMDLLKFVEF